MPEYCPLCRQQLPDKHLRMPCEKCLNRRYLQEALEREKPHLADFERATLELARDRKGKKHVALFTQPDLAYCGERVIEVASKREKKRVVDFPPGVCEVCISALRLLVAQIQTVES
jgi:hypothetical protein